MSYTLGQAARVVGRSKATIARAIKSGRLSALRTETGQFAIDDRRSRPIGELPVSGYVVGMAVRVGDDELVAVARVLGEP